jgi:hypothetical protein
LWRDSRWFQVGSQKSIGVFSLGNSDPTREEAKRNSGAQASWGQFPCHAHEELPGTLLTSKWSAEQMFLWGEKKKKHHHERQVKWLERSGVLQVYDSLSLV